MAERHVPGELLRAVERDLRPVRPLASPAWRAFALIPFGVLLVIAIPAFWGLRANVTTLGAVGTWGLSGIQALAGLLIVGAALREAIPGRTLSAAAVGTTIAAGIAIVVGVTLMTYAIAPTVVPDAARVRWLWECVGMAVMSGVPALAMVAWLVSRALPTRPAIAGAIYGLGAGVMADAGVRLFCWVSAPMHVLVSHGGAILLFVIAGAFASTFVERVKAWRVSGRHRDGAPSPR